jgi:vitamin B12 transporter
LSNGLFVRANGGQSNRAPSFLELYVPQGTLVPNPSLRPERGLFVDGAVGLAQEHLELALGGFYALYEEMYPPFLAKPFNVAAAQVVGVELEGKGEFLEWISIAGSYTLTQTANLRDDPRYFGKPLPYRPTHKAFAKLLVGRPFLKGRVEVATQSRQFINRTGTLFLPSRTFVTVGVQSRLHQAPDIQVSAEMKNALNTQASDLDGYPLPGRAFFLTLSVSMESHES